MKMWRLARFANLLSHYTGDAAARKTAEGAMKYIASPDVANKHAWTVGGILLADRELNHDPLHVTIVAAKSDSTAREMFLAALKFPTTYKRLEWYDPAAGPLPRDIEYLHAAKTRGISLHEQHVLVAAVLGGGG